jgi:hypothetical protein
MDLMLLRVFQQQVLLQCKFMLMAASEVNVGLKEANTDGVFCGVQNLLNAAANISKALWGSGGRQSEARRELRESIGVPDDSPLRDVVMRNNFEHYDERLDKWWAESKSHNHCDRNIMPKNAISGIDEIDMFRLFDPQTTNLTFWSQDFNLQQLISEVQRILPKLTEEASKPHWVK